VALPKIGFNEGSLLRRTLLHVGTFLFGSMAFIGVVSFVLVTIARSVVAPHAEAAADDEADEPRAATSAAAVAPVLPGAPKATRPHAKGRGKRGAAVPTPAPQPAKDE